MSVYLTIAPLQWQAIVTALLCGTIVGLERQLAGKPAGIRTSCLICLGTYIFVAAGTTLSGDSGDPARIVGQVVTGVGFLGAGVMLARDGIIMGVTSAAVIWLLAALGVQIGLGRYGAAVAMALITVGVLVGVNLLERSFIALQRGVHKNILVGRRKRRQGRRHPHSATDPHDA